MKFEHAVAIAILVLPISLSAGNSTHAVPDRYLGDWGTSLTDCGTEADDTALRIGERNISYQQGSGPLKAVVVLGAAELALIAELSSEDETWLNASVFEISQDGDQLTQRPSMSGESLVRVRCSSILGARPDNSYKPVPLHGSA